MHPQNLIWEIFSSLLFKIRNRGLGIINKIIIERFAFSICPKGKGGHCKRPLSGKMRYNQVFHYPTLETPRLNLDIGLPDSRWPALCEVEKMPYVSTPPPLVQRVAKPPKRFRPFLD